MGQVTANKLIVNHFHQTNKYKIHSFASLPKQADIYQHQRSSNNEANKINNEKSTKNDTTTKAKWNKGPVVIQPFYSTLTSVLAVRKEAHNPFLHLAKHVTGHLETQLW